MPFQRLSRSAPKGPAPKTAFRPARPQLEAPERPPGEPQAATQGFWSQWMDRASRFGHNLADASAPAPIQTMSAPGPAGEAAAPRENRTGLPDGLKAGIESLSGMSLDDVKVHYDSAKPAGLQALAYTQGTAIHVAPGQEEHLAHEAWHVVQQKQGRVKPTMQMKQARINDDPGLEKEAEVMGRRALKQPLRRAEPGERRSGSGAGIVQRKLSGAYAEAERVLASLGPDRAEPGALGGPVVQRLTGAYAEAAQKILAYMPSAYESRSAILQEAEDLGYEAPNLPGHMSQSSGKDDAGEAERQRQINAVWGEWVEGFEKFKSSRAPVEEEAPLPSKAKTKKKDKSKVFSPQKQVEVRVAKEEKKSARKAAKKDVYQEYVASLNGGRPSPKGFQQWKKENGYT